MNLSVCTLYEGNYHYGVAALTNSLSMAGFTGEIWVGFRGQLPPWLPGHLRQQSNPVYEPNDHIRMRFCQLETDVHLTNYKPDFMLSLLENPAMTVDGIFYFDPDICVTAPWSYFQQWVECGVALCEDINSPLSQNHPRRMGWRNHFRASGLDLTFQGGEYVNGGCIGLKREHTGFLESWRDLQEAMAPALGGLSASKLGGGTSALMNNPLFCFNASDQDALNATVELLPEFPLSIVGQEAMGFKPGAMILPHALGTPKPWTKRFLSAALAGRAPTVAEKAYWNNASGPIYAHTPSQIRSARRRLRVASAVGRLIRKS